MTKQQFEYYSDIGGKRIKQIIDSNHWFYNFYQKIVFRFYDVQDKRIVASCERKTNIINVNINCVEDAISTNNWKDIEYFLLHEIRHMFQHIQIAKFDKKQECEAPKELIKKWKYECEHYVKSINENNNENPEYFNQDSEFDAYTFSYAVMKYKYDNVSELYVPPTYGKEFYETVDEFINAFQNWKMEDEMDKE